MIDEISTTLRAAFRLSDELFEHRARTAYGTDSDRVFVSPHCGSPLNPKRYADTFRLALARAKVEGYVRPFHDARHSSITNAAAAGTSPAALMARAGHSDYKTTQIYIDLSQDRGSATRPNCSRSGFGAKAVPSKAVPRRRFRVYRDNGNRRLAGIYTDRGGRT